MNDSKEITLFVDNYNSNHSDAVLLVANYLSKDKNLSAEIIISKNNQLNLKTTTKNKKEDYLVLDLDLNSKKLDFKTYFIGLIYQAREKLGSDFPKTKIIFFRVSLKSAFVMFFKFSFNKPVKNPSKTRPEPFQNRCQKCVVFQHRFFRVSASILEGLGPPRWSQVGS